jgi:redox-sensitive bicupin YhaK (pirin superfamily)
MIEVRPAGERGKTKTNWLDSSHTFSFNRYYDPRYVGFRDLVVINEDWVAHIRTTTWKSFHMLSRGHSSTATPREVAAF